MRRRVLGPRFLSRRAAAPLSPAPRPEPPAVDGPRTWNLWDLERIAREQPNRDVAREEERSFLLMYLRDFADPGGLLPVEFDALVRDSFGAAALR